jgi:nuclear pore complex protein Nup107
MVKELSVETLSLSRTEALCGYPFDFTQPGSDEQDEAELYNHRKIPANATARTAMLKESPSAEKHAATVHRLLKASTPYHDVQLIVRLLQYFRAWRAEEDELIKYESFAPCVTAASANNGRCRAQQQAQAQDVNAPKMKQNLMPIKELLEQIGSTFNTLIASISESVKVYPNSQNGMDWDLRRAYIPEIVLAYLSVLQIASFFLQRESSTSTTIRAMEVANLVADDDNKWLQKVFLETGRMGQLVESLAHVSRAMLQVNEQEPKKGAIKKRGSRGETMRIWDLMARERL